MPRTRGTSFLIAVAVIAAVIACTLVGWGFHRFEAGLGGYVNVRLTDHRQEVLYRLGYPHTVVAEPESNKVFSLWSQRVYSTNKEVDPRNAIPEGKNIADYAGWEYDVPGTAGESPSQSALWVTFSRQADQVVEISCADTLERAHVCPALAGIRAGDSEERVLSLLGSPTRLTHKSVSKTIRYDDLGVEFVLTKGHVYGLTLFEAPRHRLATFFRRYIRAAIRA